MKLSIKEIVVFLIIIALDLGVGPVLAKDKLDDVKDTLLVESGSFSARLKEKGLVSDEKALIVYLDTVVDKVLHNELITKYQLKYYFLKDPMVNAFALPNGEIFITYGLLARLESEAQLAFIIGHEAAHVIKEHGVQQKISRRKKIVAANVADLFLMGTGLVYIPTALSLANYSREHEEESDKIGYDLIEASVYDPRDVLGVFPLLNEIKTANSHKGSVYSSHPGLKDRESRLLLKVEKSKVKEPLDNTEYLKVKNKVFLDTVRLKLNNHHYELARDFLSNTAGNDKSPIYEYLEAESYRLSVKNPDLAIKEYSWIYGKSLSKSKKVFDKNRTSYLEKAKIGYQRILEHSPDYVDAYKGLGKIYCLEEKYKLCEENLVSYLSKNPDPKDKNFIKYLIEKSKRK